MNERTLLLLYCSFYFALHNCNSYLRVGYERERTRTMHDARTLPIDFEK